MSDPKMGPAPFGPADKELTMLSLLCDGAMPRRSAATGPSLLARLARAVAESARSRRAQRELERLSARMLRDIGLEPDDVLRAP
jgi:uncharacterized protein YjiS (DUF1127 family)